MNSFNKLFVVGYLLATLRAAAAAGPALGPLPLLLLLLLLLGTACRTTLG